MRGKRKDARLTYVDGPLTIVMIGYCTLGPPMISAIWYVVAEGSAAMTEARSSTSGSMETAVPSSATK